MLHVLIETNKAWERNKHALEMKREGKKCFDENSIIQEDSVKCSHVFLLVFSKMNGALMHCRNYRKTSPPFQVGTTTGKREHFLCTSLSLKYWKQLIFFGVHVAPTFQHNPHEPTEVRRMTSQLGKLDHPRSTWMQHKQPTTEFTVCLQFTMSHYPERCSDLEEEFGRKMCHSCESNLRYLNVIITSSSFPHPS